MARSHKLLVDDYASKLTGMKVCVFGLWHLGSVTAACVAAAGFETIGLDQDEDVVNGMRAGMPPLYEPGLGDLTEEGIASGLLRFTSDPKNAIAGAAVVWITMDTPVDDDDRADPEAVLRQVRGIFPHLEDGTVVLISSQLPVGSTKALADDFAAEAGGRQVAFAYSPENLRLGTALDSFRKADRVVVGTLEEAEKEVLASLIIRFTDEILWLSVESAEMAKHALNSFLATCVVFANEIAVVSEMVGADARQVEAALRTDPRVGSRAYIGAGGAFAGGTLARDVRFVTEIARHHSLATPLLAAILPANEEHAKWTMRLLVDRLGELPGTVVGVLGLVYKPGTSTLRRSSAVELCRHISESGGRVQAYDPAVGEISDQLSFLELAESAEAVGDGADALVVATPWPEFKELRFGELVRSMRRPLILDPGRFLEEEVALLPEVEYLGVGRAQ